MREQINKVNNWKQFLNEDYNNTNYEYIIDTKQKVRPNDYCYMSPNYNDAKSGFIIKVTDEQKYPKTDDNIDWSVKDDGSVYSVEVLTPDVLVKNIHDGKVHVPKSYHLSHCNSHGSGKIISTNNPNLKL
jgi:hypothetical protein